VKSEIFALMTTLHRALIFCGSLLAMRLGAAYAPVPEQEQGKDLTVSIKAGIAHDSNLFGTPRNEVSTAVFTLAPHVTYNRSLTDQTFFSGAYGLTLDHFVDRPGDKTLDSHDASLRLAHAFTKSTTLDVTDLFSVVRNPEALLPGVAATLPGAVLNPDQSFTRNQLDGRLDTTLAPKIGLGVKARTTLFDYRNDDLGRNLNRTENLYGLSSNYAILPEVKGVAEYRHQDVFYKKQGRELKNKRSDYLMAGADYFVAKKMSVSGRLGAEWRNRAAGGDATTPYVELSGRYNYTETSFVVAGYAYTFEETSDIARFSDSKVHRFFANVQHALTPLIVASGSFSYEPAQLQGRAPQKDIDEDTVRLGAALNYLPTKNWVLTASYDHDRVWSGIDTRELKRDRVGVYAVYSF
jgi:hypothetical protein